MNLEQKLRGAKPTNEPPPFMHARIMNSLSAGENAQRSGAPRLFAALAFVTALVIVIALIPRAPKSQQLAVALKFPAVPQVTLPPSASLQQEIENLKADTRNAARGLAASFLPSQP